MGFILGGCHVVLRGLVVLKFSRDLFTYLFWQPSWKHKQVILRVDCTVPEHACPNGRIEC